MLINVGIIKISEIIMLELQRNCKGFHLRDYRFMAFIGLSFDSCRIFAMLYWICLIFSFTYKNKDSLF